MADHKKLRADATYRLLLFEDNAQHAELIVEAIRRQLPNSHLELATHAESGFKKLQEQRYDCILTDYSFHELKGPVLLRRVKKLANGTPIIVVTGRADERLGSQVLKAGAIDYVIKNQEGLKKLPAIVFQTILKERWQKNPLFIPAALAGKLLAEIDEMTERLRSINDRGMRFIETHQIRPLTRQLQKIKKVASRFTGK